MEVFSFDEILELSGNEPEIQWSFPLVVWQILSEL